MSPVEPLVHIEVAVNVNSWRRGQRHTVALTPRVEALELAGYIKILGHVNPPAPVPPPLPPAVPKRQRAQPVAVIPDGDSPGPA